MKIRECDATIFCNMEDVRTAFGEFKGVKLSRQVIDMIYRKNAKKWFKEQTDTILT
jgi:hypothetical protein